MLINFAAAAATTATLYSVRFRFVSMYACAFVCECVYACSASRCILYLDWRFWSDRRERAGERLFNTVRTLPSWISDWAHNRMQDGDNSVETKWSDSAHECWCAHMHTSVCVCVWLISWRVGGGRAAEWGKPVSQTHAQHFSITNAGVRLRCQ